MQFSCFIKTTSVSKESEAEEGSAKNNTKDIVCIVKKIGIAQIDKVSHSKGKE